MDGFPTTMQMVEFYGVFLVSGPIFFIAAVALSVHALILARARKTVLADKHPASRAKAGDGSETASPWKSGVAAMLVFLIAGMHLTGAYGSLPPRAERFMYALSSCGLA